MENYGIRMMSVEFLDVLKLDVTMGKFTDDANSTT